MNKHSILFAALLAAGCAAGPDYQRPPLPAADGYTRAPLTRTAEAAGKTQDFAPGEVPDNWWQAFGSQDIDWLVKHALRHSPTLKAAQAALRQAHENTAAQQGSYFPSVQASYSPSRQRNAVGTLSPNLTSGEPLYTLHTAQVEVSYLPDVFGLNRRTVESLAAQEAAQRFELEAARTALAANVVAAAIQIAALQAQLGAAQANAHAAHAQTELVRQQLAAGAASALDLATQATASAQAEAAIPPLEKQLEQSRDLLATLIGEPPIEIAPNLDLDALTLPSTLPLVLPSTLVERRPDVRAAEAQVMAASAGVGVAVANRLPQFPITATWGGTATQFAKMFADGNVFWSLVGNATMTVFDAGALAHRQHAAEAGLEQAVALYRLAVLGAFQNVADSLYALDADARSLKTAQAVEDASQRARDLARIQLDAGAVNRLVLLAAEQTLEQAKLARIQAQADRLADTAALYQALGGDWRENAHDEARQ